MPEPYVYVASSWRNPIQPTICAILEARGIEHYDFRNPPNGTGFAWSEIDPRWEAWRARDYIEKLDHPRAVEGFNSDMDALRRSTHTVLILPCGRSAHLELGWAVGAGKQTAILTRDGEEPELMAKMTDLITDSARKLVQWIEQPVPPRQWYDVKSPVCQMRSHDDVLREAMEELHPGIDMT